MKFFTVFAAVVAVAASAYSPVQVWSLSEIEAALNDPSTDPAQVPYLIEGLNTIVSNLFSGVDQDHVALSMPVTVTMTLEELIAAINDPRTELAVQPFYEGALNDLMAAIFAGQEQPSITLTIPAMHVQMWTLNELSAALQNPELEPETAIYLVHALNQLMSELHSGNDVTSIAVVTPPGVIAPEPVKPVEPVVVEPINPVVVEPINPVVVEPINPVVVEPINPVVVEPINPVVVEPVNPVAVKPEEVVESSPVAAPLVQLIININTAQLQTVDPIAEDTVEPTEEVSPVVDPVTVVEAPENYNPIDIISPVPIVAGGEDTGIIV